MRCFCRYIRRRSPNAANLTLKRAPRVQRIFRSQSMTRTGDAPMRQCVACTPPPPRNAMQILREAQCPHVPRGTLAPVATQREFRQPTSHSPKRHVPLDNCVAFRHADARCTNAIEQPGEAEPQPRLCEFTNAKHETTKGRNHERNLSGNGLFVISYFRVFVIGI